MRKQHTYSPVALRFRRWSRKGYAAFVSVQHTVTIGQLSAHVAERLQTKSRSIHTSAPALGETGEGEAGERENGYPADFSPLLLLQAVCPASQTAGQPAAAYAYTTTSNIPESAEGPGYPPKASRAFRLYSHETI